MAGSASPLRAIVVSPGRGAYTLDDLWPERRAEAAAAAGGPEAAYLAAWREAIAALDAARAARGAGPLADAVLSSGAKQGHDLAPDVVSALIFAAGAADWGLISALEESRAVETVAVVGLSLGWYTALHAAGALPLGDAARVVDFTGAWQVDHGIVGGQLVHPVCDLETWRPDAARQAGVERALASVSESGSGGAFSREGREGVSPSRAGVFRSIRLGGYDVLAGDERGLAALAGELRTLEAALVREGRKAQPATSPGEGKPLPEPLRLKAPTLLAKHSAFHTPLMQAMSDDAQEPLVELGWQAPARPLVDGRGGIFRPRIASPDAILDYTVGAQVVSTYDFTTSLRVALREYAPDAVLALGPGNVLGGPVGQTLVLEGWSGVGDREAFKRRQAGPEPIVHSLGLPSDRERFLRFTAAASHV